MKSNEVGTTLKHPETINGNVKNLSKRMKMKDKGECHFYFKNLTLPFITRVGEMEGVRASLNSPSKDPRTKPKNNKKKTKKKKTKKTHFFGYIFRERPRGSGSAPGARFRGVGSASYRCGSVGGSGPGARGSGELRARAGSVQ
jgi:hypothetical protein